MKIIVRILLFSYLVFASNLFSAEKQVVISVYEEWSKSLGIIKELLSASYNEIGYKVIFKDLPPARGLHELKHGRVDGDIARTEGIIRDYDVVLVRPPFFTLRAFAYYQKDKFMKTPSIDEIKNGKVGYMHGAFAVEKFLINTKLTIKANDQIQLLNLLKRRRVDYIIPSASIPVKDTNLGKTLLFEVSVHHILSANNKELAKKLEPVLKKNMSKKKYAHLEDQIKNLIFSKLN